MPAEYYCNTVSNYGIAIFFRLMVTLFQDSALIAYEKALTLDREERNADLHFNYAQALSYEQRYAAAVRHLHRAEVLDPGFPEPKERLAALGSYLLRTQASVRTKGE